MIIAHMPGFASLPMCHAAVLSNGPKPEIMLAIDFRGPFCSTFWTSKKVEKEIEAIDAQRKLPGIAPLSICLAAVLSNGPKPGIMLAIGFRGPFCSTFWTSKK